MFRCCMFSGCQGSGLPAAISKNRSAQHTVHSALPPSKGERTANQSPRQRSIISGVGCSSSSRTNEQRGNSNSDDGTTNRHLSVTKVTKRRARTHWPPAKLELVKVERVPKRKYSSNEVAPVSGELHHIWAPPSKWQERKVHCSYLAAPS